MRAKATLLALLIASPVAGDAAQAPGASPAPAGDPARVLEVLERTKLTRATYSLFGWTSVSEPGEAPRAEWAAEFHSGDLHRVETPGTRVVADCRAGTGFALSVESGEVIEGPGVANAACGINTNRVFHAAEYVGRVQTEFGPADRVRLTDDEMIRDYDVSPDGVLLGSTFRAGDEEETQILLSETVDLLRDAPDPDMFDPESLDRSFVPEAYRQAPSGF